MPKLITNENKFIIELDANDKLVLKCSGIEFHNVVESVSTDEQDCKIVLIVDNFEVSDVVNKTIKSGSGIGGKYHLSVSDIKNLLVSILKQIPDLSVIKNWSAIEKEKVAEWAAYILLAGVEDNNEFEVLEKPDVLKDFELKDNLKNFF